MVRAILIFCHNLVGRLPGASKLHCAAQPHESYSQTWLYFLASELLCAIIPNRLDLNIVAAHCRPSKSYPFVRQDFFWIVKVDMLTSSFRYDPMVIPSSLVAVDWNNRDAFEISPVAKSAPTIWDPCCMQRGLDMLVIGPVFPALPCKNVLAEDDFGLPVRDTG